MTLDVEKVLEKFLLYSGESSYKEPADTVEAEREKLLRLLCEEGCARVEIQIRDEKKAQTLVSELEALAAAHAFCQLALLDEAAVPKSISTPELKLERGEKAACAGRLYEEKRKACAEVLLSPDFYFGRVG